MDKLMPTKGRRYLLEPMLFGPQHFWLMEEDENDPKGRYIDTISMEEARKIDPEFVARVRARRLALFPACDVSDKCFELYLKRGRFEKGEISLTPEEAEALDKEIKALSDEYERLTSLHDEEEKKQNAQAGMAGHGDIK
jgi:hypothetical protein